MSYEVRSHETQRKVLPAQPHLHDLAALAQLTIPVIPGNARFDAAHDPRLALGLRTLDHLGRAGETHARELAEHGVQDAGG